MMTSLNRRLASLEVRNGERRQRPITIEDIAPYLGMSPAAMDELILARMRTPVEIEPMSRVEMQRAIEVFCKSPEAKYRYG